MHTGARVGTDVGFFESLTIKLGFLVGFIVGFLVGFLVGFDLIVGEKVGISLLNSLGGH